MEAFFVLKFDYSYISCYSNLVQPVNNGQTPEANKLKAEGSFFMAKLGFEPNWKQHEKTLADSDGDAFIDARDRETQTSEQARSWEEGRKKEWADSKPEYVRKRNQKELDKSKETIESLLDGGDFQEEIVPSPGLILIKLDAVPDRMGELFLSVSNDDTPNTGTVIEVGENEDFKFAHSKGDRVIIRKFSANLHVNVRGEKYFFILFSDVLGRFK